MAATGTAGRSSETEPGDTISAAINVSARSTITPARNTSISSCRGGDPAGGAVKIVTDTPGSCKVNRSRS